MPWGAQPWLTSTHSSQGYHLNNLEHGWPANQQSADDVGNFTLPPLHGLSLLFDCWQRHTHPCWCQQLVADISGTYTSCLNNRLQVAQRALPLLTAWLWPWTSTNKQGFRRSFIRSGCAALLYTAGGLKDMGMHHSLCIDCSHQVCLQAREYARSQKKLAEFKQVGPRGQGKGGPEGLTAERHVV
jgi:hypothetical protein